MAGALDTRMRALANRLIPKYGATLTYTSTTPAAYTNGAGWGSASTSTDSIVGVVSNFDQNLIDNSNIKNGDLKIIIDAQAIDDASITPSTDDTITLNSVVYQVVSVTPIPSGELNAAYEFQVRQGT